MDAEQLKTAIAHSSSDKHELLQHRDKLVRTALGLHMKKQTELSEAVELCGTCEDMCPERERYIREDRNQLHVYERLDGDPNKVNHRLAVKEYSRSSADQDLPLPHELRPGPVLDRTMHYLLNNIADRGGDGQWADWFDFLWNRTRSIRKDITQQRLGDLTAVGLVEKCARFHIYCSERLCEEDMMCFDAKINNENLTKCLQTIKEMYFDLQSKQIYCPNEAEFRAYMVLMNLNSGDILREVQQLRADLRAAPVIGFVVRVYSALNSNNYRRFFRLVRQGGFLNACLMHRYFYQVRKRSFHVMANAYNKKELCPIDDLVPLLGFDSAEEIVGFCQHHGLQVENGSHVVLDRAAMVEPETSYEQLRARNLIESMQTTSLGEVINGGPLPENIMADPVQVSFDSAGRFIGKDLEDLPRASALAAPVKERLFGKAGRVSPDPGQGSNERSVNPAPLFGRSNTLPAPSEARGGRASPGASMRPPTPSAEEESTGADEQYQSEHEQQQQQQHQQEITNEVVKEVAKSLFLDVIREMTEDMSNKLIQAVRLYLSFDRPVTAEFLMTQLPVEMRSVCEEAITECQQEAEEAEARARAEHSLRMRRAEDNMLDVLVKEQTDTMISDIVRQQIRENEEKLKKQSIERCTKTIAHSLLDEVADYVISDVANDVFVHDVTDRLAELAENKRLVELMLLTRYFRCWKNKYAARQRLKTAMITFPAVPRLSSGRVVGGKRPRVTHETPLNLEQKRARLGQEMSLRTYWREIQRDLAFAPLNVAQILHQQLCTNTKESTTCKTGNSYMPFTGVKAYVKILLYLSDPDAEISNWFSSKLQKGAVPNPPVPNVARYLSLYSTQHEHRGESLPLSVCVAELSGGPSTAQYRLLTTETPFLSCVNAVIFVLPPNILKTKLWSKEISRLRAVLSNTRCHEPPTLAVIATDDCVLFTDIETHLDLAKLKSQGQISRFTMHIISDPWDQPASSKLLKTVLRNAVCRERDNYVVKSLSVADYFEHFTYAHFFSIVYERLSRHDLDNDLTGTDVIELYNHVMEYLLEFAAIKQQYLGEEASVARLPDQLTLPSLNDGDQAGNATGLDRSVGPTGGSGDGVNRQTGGDKAVQRVYNYVQQVAHDFSKNKALLYNKIFHVVRLWQRRVDAELFSDHVTPPWVSAILACVEYKLAELAANFAYNKEGEENLLYFRRSALERVKPPLLELITDAQYPAKPPPGQIEIKPIPVNAASRTPPRSGLSTRRQNTPGGCARLSVRNVQLHDDVMSPGIVTGDVTVGRQSPSSLSMVCHASAHDLAVLDTSIPSNRMLNGTQGTPLHRRDQSANQFTTGAAGNISMSLGISQSPLRGSQSTTITAKTSIETSGDMLNTVFAASPFAQRTPRLSQFETGRNTLKRTVVNDFTKNDVSKDCENMMSLLEWTVEREKQRNDDFEQYLKAMIDEDSSVLGIDLNI